MSDDDRVSVAAVLLRGHLVILSIRAAVELGVFEVIESGSASLGPDVSPALSLDAVAARLSVGPGPLTRLINVLVDVGLVVPPDAETDLGPAAGTGRGRQGYRLTSVGAAFVEGHPSRLRDLVLMRTERPVLDSWERLADALRTDAGVFEAVNGVDYWTHLVNHPDQASRFNGAMARRGLEQAEALASAGALAGTRTLLDVGGGQGAMVAELVRRNPDLTGLVADRPEVAAAANAAFAQQGLSDRASSVSVDFFIEVPAGADAYAVCSVLHDWDDEDCRRILGTVRAAMTAGKHLWVVERHLDAERSADALQELHLMDLHMLVMFGARERTRREYERLLVSSGFRVTSVIMGRDWDVIGAQVD